MKNRTKRCLIFLTLSMFSYHVFSDNTKNYYFENDSIKIFPIEVKESIANQLKEIWNCKDVIFQIIEKPKKILIIDIGLISNTQIDRFEDFKLATNFVLDRKIKVSYGFSEGKIKYKINLDNNIESKEFNLFEILNSVPVAEDCSLDFTQPELKNCFKNYIVNYFNENFDPKKFKDFIDLDNKNNKVIVQFTISKNKLIENINITYNNEIIKNEFYNITKSLKFIEPGYKNSKPYDIKYAIPIYFFIE